MISGTKRIIRAYIPVFLFGIVYLSGCLPAEAPYLILDVETEYNQSIVYIPYVFSSEEDNQQCRIIITKEDGAEGEEVYNQDRWLYKEGDLSYNLENGFYTLDITMLSNRKGQTSELAFLSESYSFSVQTIDGGGYNP